MLKNKLKIGLLVTFLLLTPLFGLSVLAEEIGADATTDRGADAVTPGEFPNPLRADDVVELFVDLANWIAGIVAVLAVLMIVFAGFQYLFSGGDADRIKKANRTIIWSLVGLGIVILSWSILKTIMMLLNVK